MFSGILLPGTTELYTVFKKGSSWKCTFTRQKMFSRRAWSIYVTPLDLFSLFLLNFLLAYLMHMWMESIPMIRFLLVLPHYRYTGNSTSSFNNVSIPCLSTVDHWWLNLIAGDIWHHYFEFVVWEFTYNSDCHRNWSITLYHLFAT